MMAIQIRMLPGTVMRQSTNETAAVITEVGNGECTSSHKFFMKTIFSSLFLIESNVSSEYVRTLVPDTTILTAGANRLNLFPVAKYISIFFFFFSTKLLIDDLSKRCRFTQ